MNFAAAGGIESCRRKHTKRKAQLQADFPNLSKLRKWPALPTMRLMVCLSGHWSLAVSLSCTIRQSPLSPASEDENDAQAHFLRPPCDSHFGDRVFLRPL